jgi:hypothetical protein
MDKTAGLWEQPIRARAARLAPGKENVKLSNAFNTFHIPLPCSGEHVLTRHDLHSVFSGDVGELFQVSIKTAEDQEFILPARSINVGVA